MKKFINLFCFHSLYRIDLSQQNFSFPGGCNKWVNSNENPRFSYFILFYFILYVLWTENCYKSTVITVYLCVRWLRRYLKKKLNKLHTFFFLIPSLRFYCTLLLFLLLSAVVLLHIICYFWLDNTHTHTIQYNKKWH